MIAHGIDHYRYEHLQKLWGYKDQDSHQQEFRLLYTKLINKLICADIPPDVRSFLSSKGDNDIRPLGKINLD